MVVTKVYFNNGNCCMQYVSDPEVSHECLPKLFAGWAISAEISTSKTSIARCLGCGESWELSKRCLLIQVENELIMDCKYNVNLKAGIQRLFTGDDLLKFVETHLDLCQTGLIDLVEEIIPFIREGQF